MSGAYDDPRRRAETDQIFLNIEKTIEEIRATRGKIIQQAADTDLKRVETDLNRKRLFWETPRAILLIVATTAAIVGGLAGALGYKIGTTPAAPIVIQMPR
jgi:hypothetical protein